MANPNDDLILVERMLLKMGTVDTDEDLETCLSKVLPHTISMLVNPSESLQSRVLELLTHINKRLKSRPCVQVPVEKLLALYQQPEASAYIINFAMIYIKLGFPRLPPEKRVDLLPQLVLAANNLKPSPTDPTHSLSLIFLFLGSLHLVKLNNQSNKPFESLNEAPQASTIILHLIQNILLYPYGWKGGNETPAEISRTAYKQLLTNLPEISKSEYLEKLKVTCLKMITCGVYPERKTFTLLVIASADARSSVFSVADTQLRKISQKEEKHVEGLYAVYLGGGTGDNRRGHASTRLRLKMLPYMAKSPHVPWPQALQVLFDSLYGENTNMKLRDQALKYCLNLIDNVGEKQLGAVGEVMLNSGLLQLIKSDWAEPPLVRQAFTCIGYLVSKLPQLASESLLKNLFYILSQERDQEVCSSVRDCMVRMAMSYKQEGECLWLEQLVSQGLTKTHSPKAMSAALHYLTQSLAHTTSRIYLLLISTSHLDHEVSTSAKKALYGVNYANGGLLPSDISLPPFDQLLSLILEKELSKPVDSILHSQMVFYLRLCLAKSAGAPVSLDPLEHPCEHSPLISSHLSSLHAKSEGISQHLSRYLQFLFNIIKKNLCVITLAAIIEVLGCLPDVIRPLLEDKIDQILNQLNHSKEDVRRLCAQLVALGVGSERLEGLIVEMLGRVDKSSSALESTHGALLTAGYALQRAHQQLSPQSSHLIKNIVGCLESPQSVLVGGACQALALSAASGPLPLSAEDKLSLVDQLLDILYSSKHSIKIKESCCTTLGNLCVGENFAHQEKIISHFLDHTKEVKDISLVLSMGESLVACVLGSSGEAGLDPWTQTPWTQLAPPPSPELSAASLLSSLLGLVSVPHPNTKQCCCFWLLSVTKRCSHLKTIREQLQDIQNAFMELLSDQNSLVQEAASRGLALVYQNGGEGLDRSQLLSKLVNQLMSGKRSVNQVSEDTQLFEEGQLGASPTGGNLSTYKELCSLASDLNKPDLIYKFMSLANHNAVWNSKKGAAFGVSTLVDLAGPEIEEHLPNIIAKLYRYQYDPTPSIQQTMTGIWQAFTANIPNAVEKYSVEIFKDLKTNITSNQWRVRKSSCKALVDFIRSPASNKPLFEVCLDEMADLWMQLFRVMDDVHESTRESAVATTRTLARICVRECEKATHKEALAAAILPVILNKGIKSSVAEVRSVSVTTLSDLVKVGVASKEVVTLVPALLIAAQELESTSLSHLSVMVSGSQAAQELVDSARASAIKSHFTVQTLNKCVEFIKPDMLEELAPQLVDMLKSSVGLGARLATCHFLTLLSHQTPLEHIQPYIGKFLAGLLHGLVDRNAVVRKQYAQTIGQLCRYAKDQSIDRLLTKLSQLYFDKEDDGVRLTVGLTLQAMTTQNQEVIKSRAAVVLPLAFFAKHHLKPADTNVDGGVGEKLVEVWEEVCDDVGGLSGIVTFSAPIADLLLTHLQSPEWAAKAQSGRGIETLASKGGEALPVEVRTRLVGGVIAALSGRTWDNKHFLLRALIPLIKHNKNSDECFSIVIALEKECEREKVEYKKHALKALGDSLHILDINRFNSIYGIIQSIISPRGEQKKSLGDEERSNGSGELLDSAYELLGKAWPADDLDTQERMVEEVLSGLVSRLGSVPRSTQAAILNSIVLIVEKLSCLKAPVWNSNACLVTGLASQSIQFAFGVTKHTNLRKAALNLLMLLINRTKDKSEEDLVKLESIFLSFKDELEKDTSSEVRSRMADTKEAFKQCKKY